MFYIALAEDAYILNGLIGLKVVKYSDSDYDCKVGIPESSLRSYIQKLRGLNISFVIYDTLKSVLNREYIGKLGSDEAVEDTDEDAENKYVKICEHECNNDAIQIETSFDILELMKLRDTKREINNRLSEFCEKVVLSYCE